MKHKHFFSSAVSLAAAAASLALAALAAPVFAHAASPSPPTLYFETPTSTVAAGSVFPVRVLLTADEPLNVYSVAVKFRGPLDFANANNAHSIITIWQNNPNASQGNEIAVQGGSLAPFGGGGGGAGGGETGELVTLNFKAVATGTAAFAFYNSYVYRADGKGTEVVPATKPLKVSIVNAPAASSSAAEAASSTSSAVAQGDTTPPEIKILTLIADPLNSDRKLLGFLAVDSDSGIRETAVRYRTGFFWTAWQSTANPAPIPRSAWEVDFKAVDNAGNASERAIYDWSALLTPRIVAVAALGLALAATIFFIARRIFRP